MRKVERKRKRKYNKNKKAYILIENEYQVIDFKLSI